MTSLESYLSNWLVNNRKLSAREAAESIIKELTQELVKHEAIIDTLDYPQFQANAYVNGYREAIEWMERSMRGQLP